MSEEFQSVFLHGDCMDMLHSLADKTIDLAIVDPPYGIALDRMTMGAGGGCCKAPQPLS